VLKKFTTNCHCQIAKSHNNSNFFLDALNSVPPHKHWDTCKDNPILKQNVINLHACDTVQISGRVAVTSHTPLTCEWIKGKIVSVLHYAPRHEDVQGSAWRHSSACWIEMSGSFMRRAHYPPGKGSRYPLNKRLGRPQSRCACLGGNKEILHLPGIEPRTLERPKELPSRYTKLPTPGQY